MPKRHAYFDTKAFLNGHARDPFSYNKAWLEQNVMASTSDLDTCLEFHDNLVFMDAYKQSFYMGAEVNRDLSTRMSWVYRRAGLAMLITSTTTAAAFVAT